jgi:hypothetical protein
MAARALPSEWPEAVQDGLFGMQNRKFGPYLAAIHMIFIPVMDACAGKGRKLSKKALESRFRWPLTELRRVNLFIDI